MTSDEARQAIEGWSPPRARDLLPSAGMGRGGRREGAGRPRLAGEGGDRAPRWTVSMSPAAIAAAEAYGEQYGRGEKTLALRELAEAWGEDEAVKRAIEAWKARKA